MAGVKLAIEELPGRMGPSQEIKSSLFSPTLRSRGPLGPKLGPLEPRMGTLMLKIDYFRPDMGPPKQVNCLFSLIVDIERFQYLIGLIENGSPGSERVVKFHPAPSPLPLAARLCETCI